MLHKLNFTSSEYNLPSVWCQSASRSGFPSPLTRAVTLNISILKRRTTPQDPSNIKFLQYIVDIASNILVTYVRNSTASDTCGCCNIEKVNLYIIALPMVKSVSLSLKRFLSWKSDLANKWFSLVCNGY